MKIHKIPTMWMTVGFPGTGKSTWAKATGMPVVETDDYRWVDGVYVKTDDREPAVWRQHDRKMRSFLMLGTSLILCDCFLTRSVRRRYAIQAFKHSFRVVVMWFKAPQALYERDGTHSVPVEKYEEMRGNFQEPSVENEALAAVYVKERGYDS